MIAINDLAGFIICNAFIHKTCFIDFLHGPLVVVNDNKIVSVIIQKSVMKNNLRDGYKAL